MYRANQDERWSCVSSTIITPAAVTHARSGKIGAAKELVWTGKGAPEVPSRPEELLMAAGGGKVTFLF